MDLGGFTFSFLADGSPGTGKTTLIQMIVTLLREYTGVAGVPLRYRNFSVDEISDYQGRSGQNARRFCDEILDPRGVGFGSLDDVDQVCGNRSDRNASAGQLEVTAVLMQQLGGASTVVRGNASFGLFSNYPEKVDDALRQRAQARFLVDGPQTREDFTDLFHILLGSPLRDAARRGLHAPRDAAGAGGAREVRRARGAPRPGAAPDLRREVTPRPAASRAGAPSASTSTRCSSTTSRFTGRAVKSVADAVLARRMDFDLPAEWFERREPFFAQPFERKQAMLEELCGPITPELVLQELHRYADSEARYQGAAASRAFEERTEQLVLESRARRAAAERESAG